MFFRSHATPLYTPINLRCLTTSTKASLIEQLEEPESGRGSPVSPSPSPVSSPIFIRLGFRQFGLPSQASSLFRHVCSLTAELQPVVVWLTLCCHRSLWHTGMLWVSDLFTGTRCFIPSRIPLLFLSLRFSHFPPSSSQLVSSIKHCGVVAASEWFTICGVM